MRLIRRFPKYPFQCDNIKLHKVRLRNHFFAGPVQTPAQKKRRTHESPPIRQSIVVALTAATTFSATTASVGEAVTLPRNALLSGTDTPARALERRRCRSLALATAWCPFCKIARNPKHRKTAEGGFRVAASKCSRSPSARTPPKCRKCMRSGYAFSAAMKWRRNCSGVAQTAHEGRHAVVWVIGRGGQRSRNRSKAAEAALDEVRRRTFARWLYFRLTGFAQSSFSGCGIERATG